MRRFALFDGLLCGGLLGLRRFREGRLLLEIVSLWFEMLIGRFEKGIGRFDKRVERTFYASLDDIYS